MPCLSFPTVSVDGAKGKQHGLKELGGRIKKNAKVLSTPHFHSEPGTWINFVTVNSTSLLIVFRIPFHHFGLMQRIRGTMFF